MGYYLSKLDISDFQFKCAKCISILEDVQSSSKAKLSVDRYILFSKCLMLMNFCRVTCSGLNFQKAEKTTMTEIIKM